MERIAIDLEALDALSRDLTAVAVEFDNANTNSDQIAAAVGQAHLAQTVRGFAHKWDDTRAKMAEAIRSLSEEAASVAETWRDVDRQEADALVGECQS